MSTKHILTKMHTARLASLWLEYSPAPPPSLTMYSLCTLPSCGIQSALQVPGPIAILPASIYKRIPTAEPCYWRLSTAEEELALQTSAMNASLLRSRTIAAQLRTQLRPRGHFPGPMTTTTSRGSMASAVRFVRIMTLRIDITLRSHSLQRSTA